MHILFHSFLLYYILFSSILLRKYQLFFFFPEVPFSLLHSSVWRRTVLHHIVMFCPAFFFLTSPWLWLLKSPPYPFRCSVIFLSTSFFLLTLVHWSSLSPPLPILHYIRDVYWLPVPCLQKYRRVSDISFSHLFESLFQQSCRVPFNASPSFWFEETCVSKQWNQLHTFFSFR